MSPKVKEDSVLDEIVGRATNCTHVSQHWDLLVACRECVRAPLVEAVSQERKALRAEHVGKWLEYPETGDGEEVCALCGNVMPCPTTRQLDAREEQSR